MDDGYHDFNDCGLWDFFFFWQASLVSRGLVWSGYDICWNFSNPDLNAAHLVVSDEVTMDMKCVT